MYLISSIATLRRTLRNPCVPRTHYTHTCVDEALAPGTAPRHTRVTRDGSDALRCGNHGAAASGASLASGASARLPLVGALVGHARRLLLVGRSSQPQPIPVSLGSAGARLASEHHVGTSHGHSPDAAVRRGGLDLAHSAVVVTACVCDPWQQQSSRRRQRSQRGRVVSNCGVVRVSQCGH